MSQIAKRPRTRDAERYQAVTAARERFLAGDDRVRGVRPEIATSWYRCREQYHVDPGLNTAPPASEQAETSDEHTLEHEIVFAQLGGAAASIATEVESLGGVVTVTDGAARVLTVQGDKETLHRAKDSNMAPWSCWSEWATGTNGMGTALEAPGPVLINGPEHWCEGFHEWVCAGVAVRDPVTHDPVAVLDVSAWRATLPPQAAGWLSKAVGGARSILRQRAHDGGAELAAAFAKTRARSGQALAALDARGKVVIANEGASLFLGVPARVPALDPTVRWQPSVNLEHLARFAVKQAGLDHSWVGSTQIVTGLSSEPFQLTLRPVFLGDQPVGTLAGLRSGQRRRDRARAARARAEPPAAHRGRERRSHGPPAPARGPVRGGGRQRRLARHRRRSPPGRGPRHRQARGGAHGRRLPARPPAVPRQPGRASARSTAGPKGELSLIMDGAAGETVPVSRRNLPAVRRALGL